MANERECRSCSYRKPETAFAFYRGTTLRSPDCSECVPHPKLPGAEGPRFVKGFPGIQSPDDGQTLLVQVAPGLYKEVERVEPVASPDDPYAPPEQEQS